MSFLSRFAQQAVQLGSVAGIFWQLSMSASRFGMLVPAGILTPSLLAMLGVRPTSVVGAAGWDDRGARPSTG
jgi:hypothetical protein